ncbi:MAG: PEGA domain-containing protein [Melioribacteraceae bacterium]|nr:PEGA domain-containing protein [Melioribacteraceae bacterium]
MLKRILSISCVILCSITVLFSCDKEVSLAPKYNMVPEKAMIFIDSKPPKARIFADGKNTGLLTPDTVKWLSNSEHEITLKMNLFTDFTFTMNANDEQVNNYYHNYYNYEYNFAKLNIFSEPDSAAIYFNDSLLTEKTPHTIKNIFPGNHKVKLTYPEHRADSINLFLTGGNNKNLNITLTDTSIWVNYNQSNSQLKSYKLNDLAVYNNKIWIATNEEGIVTFDRKRWDFINTSNSGLSHDAINKLVLGPNGNIWVCTHQGLSIYNGSVWNSYTTFNSNLPHNFLSDVAFDNNGIAWITTQNGLVSFDGNIFKVYNSGNSAIPTNFFTTIAIDHQNRKWLGTNGWGIIRFDSENWDFFSKFSHALPGNSINNISVDNNGNIWAAIRTITKKGAIIDKGGIVRYNMSEWKELDFQITLRDAYDFYHSDDGTIWLGTRSGLIWYKADADFTLFRADNSGLIRNEITSIIKDEIGNIWSGATGGGLTKYKIWKIN